MEQIKRQSKLFKGLLAATIASIPFNPLVTIVLFCATCITIKD